MLDLGAGKVLAVVAGILTILGTFVFASFTILSAVGSGLGFIENLDLLFSNAQNYANSLNIHIILYWVIIAAFLVFLGSGFLQLVGVKSRAAIFIFSLFPLAVGMIFILLTYTEFLGNKSTFFTIFFSGEYYGDFYPILIELGDLALGTYLLIGGGVLGIVSALLPREEYY